MFGSLGVLFGLMWKARSTPLNYILLGIFTVLEGHLVGTVGMYNLILLGIKNAGDDDDDVIIINIFVL